MRFGIEIALEDLPRKGKPQRIDMNARAWFLSLACRKPKELGFASEHWTTCALAKYTRDNCETAGYPCLKKLSKGTVSKIMNNSNIRPHKTSYYLEKKDPDFDTKMEQVLHVYKEVEIYKKSGEKNVLQFYHMMRSLGFRQLVMYLLIYLLLNTQHGQRSMNINDMVLFHFLLPLI